MTELIENRISDACIVGAYIARVNQGPIPQLNFGNVVKLTFTARAETDFENIERLALVLTTEKKKTGCFEGLILPCSSRYAYVAPNDRQIMSLPKRCAELVDNGESIKEILGTVCEALSQRDDFDDDIPF